MIKCKKERCNLAYLKGRDRDFIIIERGKEKKDHQRGYISKVKIKIIVYSFFLSERESHITQMAAVDEGSDHDFSCYVIPEKQFTSIEILRD